MKKFLLLFSLTLSILTCVNAQIITTIGGNFAYGAGYSGDGGPATLAEMNEPAGIAIDAIGNLYIADYKNEVIRKIDNAGIITTFAGNGYQGIGFGGYSGDGGQATSAELAHPYAVTFDSAGELIIADAFNFLIRKVDVTGIISSIAGNHIVGYSGDGGAATSAELAEPNGVAYDSHHNLYISDFGNTVVRKISTTGIISTVAGNNAYGTGFSGDGGPATSAELYNPVGIILDKNDNLYIEDYYNNIVRMVNSSGIINTVVGNYSFGAGYSGDGGQATSAEISAPDGLLFDPSGNLIISDYHNQVIRMVTTSGIISTIAGNNAYGAGYSGDGGPPTAAEMNGPCGLVFDLSGDLIVVEYHNNVIRRIGNLTGSENLKSKSENLKVFPSPANNEITIQATSIIKQINLFDVKGRRILEQKVGSLCSLLKTGDLSNGIYYLKAIMEAGNVIVQKVEIIR